MKNTIYLLEGTYRNKTVENQTFQVVKGYQPHPHKEGGFITVKIDDLEKFPGATKKQIRINVENENQLRDSAPEQPKEESDAETVERMRKRFTILDSMTKACKKGDVRAMIVSGPPGVGKSFGVETVLDRYGVVSTLGNTAPKYEVVKGAMSPIGLYCKLYNYSGADNVLVFDDCDSILLDDLSLNILKAALDSKKTRRICWNTDSHMLRREGVPDTFNFAGSVIFITNIKFDNLEKSVQAYMHNINTHGAYYSFRVVRRIAEKVQYTDPISAKVKFLAAYAEIGDKYVDKLELIIESNKLRDFDRFEY